MKYYEFDISNFNETEFNKWFSLMDEKKQERVNKFRFPEDKKRTVAGEMLAKKAIAENSDAEIENIVFCKNEFGKPYIKDLNVEFNISHSGNMVVCVADNSPVGIDIEKVREIKLNTIKKILNEDELQYVFDNNPVNKDNEKMLSPDISRRFFEIWTKKEAFVKKQGRSIFAFNEECKCNFSTFSSEDDDGNTYIVTIAHS